MTPMRSPARRAAPDRRAILASAALHGRLASARTEHQRPIDSATAVSTRSEPHQRCVPQVERRAALLARGTVTGRFRRRNRYRDSMTTSYATTRPGSHRPVRRNRLRAVRTALMSTARPSWRAVSQAIDCGTTAILEPRLFRPPARSERPWRDLSPLCTVSGSRRRGPTRRRTGCRPCSFGTPGTSAQPGPLPSY